MISKLVAEFGVIRLVVKLATLIAVGVALDRIGLGALPIAVITGALILVFLTAPFGAQNRRNF